VRRLAASIYEERGTLDAVRLGMLAEAELLAHLRKPGPHWRGCWAVDHIIGI
jgi:hypothetical protein